MQFYRQSYPEASTFLLFNYLNVCCARGDTFLPEVTIPERVGAFLCRLGCKHFIPYVPGVWKGGRGEKHVSVILFVYRLFHGVLKLSILTCCDHFLWFYLSFPFRSWTSTFAEKKKKPLWAHVKATTIKHFLTFPSLVFCYKINICWCNYHLLLLHHWFWPWCPAFQLQSPTKLVFIGGQSGLS